MRLPERNPARVRRRSAPGPAGDELSDHKHRPARL